MKSEPARPRKRTMSIVMPRATITWVRLRMTCAWVSLRLKAMVAKAQHMDTTAGRKSIKLHFMG